MPVLQGWTTALGAVPGCTVIVTRPPARSLLQSDLFGTSDFCRDVVSWWIATADMHG